MDGELTKDGANDIHVEDIRLGALLGETLNRLGNNISISELEHVR
jgi:hypothetical protein